MHRTSQYRGFTLIELLTVIAIIAVLAAILFPLAGTLREQARASSCMSNLHQLYVSAKVYKEDEGGYPPALLGYAEVGIVSGGNCDTARSTGIFYDGTNAPVVNGAPCLARADSLLNGFLYREQVKDINLFKCPNNTNTSRSVATVALFPPRPPDWPSGAEWIGDRLAAAGCPTVSGLGTVDCWTSGPLSGQPKYFYVWDSYDISPMIGTNGQVVRDSSNNPIYERRYSIDWTGVEGASDLPHQMKYRNPPEDRTILAACSWHTATAGAPTYTTINLGGSARKVRAQDFLRLGGGGVFAGP